MFYFCVFTKNEMAGGELIGGFTLFLRKLLKEVMDDAEIPTTNSTVTPDTSTTTSSTIVIGTKPN